MRIAAAIFVVFLVCYTCGTIIDDHKVLIQLAENEEPIWMTPHQRNELKKAGISFVDVTNFQDRPAESVPGAPPLPNQPQQKFYVKSLLPKLNTNNMRSNVEILSDLRTRFYTTSTGTQAAEWIHSTLKAYASNRPDITVEFFNSTTTKPQPSVIARFPGQLSSDLAIIGCHEDSVNLGSVGTSPGVDDDGSGVVCNLEIFRVLATSGFMPNRTVEFHFYAAEEVGLLGSQAVASTYADENKVVVGMMQLDMTLYPGTNNENVVGVVVDYTDPDLSEFTRELVEAYTDIPWVDTVCGYGCSDHYSWTKEGYRSTFPFESEFSKKNPYIHSAQDTLAHADFQHALQFAKLGLGFVVELGATNYMD